jgi:hypothetical protein
VVRDCSLRQASCHFGSRLGSAPSPVVQWPFIKWFSVAASTGGQSEPVGLDNRRELGYRRWRTHPIFAQGRLSYGCSVPKGIQGRDRAKRLQDIWVNALLDGGWSPAGNGMSSFEGSWPAPCRLSPTRGTHAQHSRPQALFDCHHHCTPAHAASSRMCTQPTTLCRHLLATRKP